MSRLCSLLITMVCRLIRQDACEALLGDLAEAGASNTATLAGLIGFLARSQLQAWRLPRPWLVLTGIAVPAGLLLNVVVSQLANSQSVYVWMYAHNWTNTYLQAGWLWSEMVPMLCGMLYSWLQVALLSGLSGFVLVRRAHRTAWLHGMVLVLLIVSGQSIGYAVLPASIFPVPNHAAIQANAAAFATNFYRVVLPLMAQLLFAVAPAMFGMHWALNGSKRRQCVQPEA